MKVRIGYGLGTRASSDPDRFAALVTGLEARRFDSLWLSERVTGDCPDPIGQPQRVEPPGLQPGDEGGKAIRVARRPRAQSVPDAHLHGPSLGFGT